MFLWIELYPIRQVHVLASQTLRPHSVTLFGDKVFRGVVKVGSEHMSEPSMMGILVQRGNVSMETLKEGGDLKRHGERRLGKSRSVTSEETSRLIDTLLSCWFSGCVPIKMCWFSHFLLNNKLSKDSFGGHFQSH